MAKKGKGKSNKGKKRAVPNQVNKSIPKTPKTETNKKVKETIEKKNSQVNQQTQTQKQKGVNEGILENFMNDMHKLMEQVRVSGLVKNDKVYLTTSEVRESLDNYLSVFGNLDNEGYFNRFNKRLSEFGIETDEFDGETIYFVRV